ncbi:unnamed protein product [Oncorhynchus mykiss]|uniref:Protein quaking putative nuclear localisation signal domain-containing protein n=1 Tax=Oncorhynchus mykiss TaxID=8022 RepID=A0A060XGK0_ONCMY|nr:unnamed protein product [Oncorhynchus mykiss]
MCLRGNLLNGSRPGPSKEPKPCDCKKKGLNSSLTAPAFRQRWASKDPPSSGKQAVHLHPHPIAYVAEGEDSLKRMQLMELAILNGTYRDANIKSPALAFSFAANAQAPRIITGPAPMPQNALRTPTPAGPTLMPLIRQIQTCMPNGSPHPGVMTQGPEAGLIYASPYDYPYTLAPATSILEYPIDSSGVLASSKAEELPLYLGFQTCHFPITVQRGEPSNRPPF